MSEGEILGYESEKVGVHLLAESFSGKGKGRQFDFNACLMECLSVVLKPPKAGI